MKLDLVLNEGERKERFKVFLEKKKLDDEDYALLITPGENNLDRKGSTWKHFTTGRHGLSKLLDTSISAFERLPTAIVAPTVLKSQNGIQNIMYSTYMPPSPLPLHTHYHQDSELLSSNYQDREVGSYNCVAFAEERTKDGIFGQVGI